MKKFLFILGIVVIATTVFVGGLYVGLTSDFMNTMYQVSTFDKKLTNASMTFMRVSYLDEEKIDDVKSLLNSELDGHIIILSQMLKDCPNIESQKHAQEFLARVATHRQKHPSTNSYSDFVSPSEMQKIDMHIQSVLDNALKNNQ
jgi:hypothetical protein